MDYENLALETFDQFNNLINADWVFGYEANGVTLSRLSKGNKSWCLTVGNVPIEMDKLIEFTHSSIETFFMEKRVHWDKSTAEYQIVQNINEHIDVVYTQTKDYMAISSRDFVNIRYSKKHNLEGLECFISCSAPTTHPNKPPHSSLLRAETNVSGWKFIPSPEGTKVYYICGASLGGWIPSSIVNYGIESTTIEFYKLCTDYFDQLSK